MPFIRVTAQWSGFTGSPGYSRFCFSGDGTGGEDQAAQDSVQGFFSLLATRLPMDVSITVEPQYEIYDDQAVLTDYGTVSTPEDVVDGSSSGPYSGASGAVVNWITATVNGGRLVRGRTFLVPMGSNAYQDDGTLGTTPRADIETAAQQLVGISPTHVIVSRRPGVVALAPVLSARVPDLAAVLRSRRD